MSLESRKELLIAIEAKLHFVTLSKFFRLMGQVPDRILRAGYDPNTDPQIAIFGSKNDLVLWRDLRDLSPVDYPTHLSSMGAHIDVYGQDNINQLIGRNSMTGVREYFRSINKS